MKKYFNRNTILLIIFILIIAGAFIFSRCFKKNNNNTNTSASANISQIYQADIFSPVISSDGKYMFYFSNKDSQYHFYKLELANLKNEKISDKFDAPQSIYWSPQQDKALLEVLYNQYIFEKYGSMFIQPGITDGAKTFWLYDFNKNKLTPLSTSIKTVAWSLNGTQIAYQFLPSDQKIGSLSIANPDGSNWKNVVDLGSGDYKLEWLDDKNIAFWNKPANNNQPISMNKVNVDNGVPEAIVTKIDISDAKFLKDKNYLLVKTVNTAEKRETAGIINLADQQKQFIDLGISTDLKNISFDSQNNLYYYSDNKFFKFDLNQKKTIELATFGNQPDYLFFDENSKLLYFVYNNNLYKLAINNQ
ncbi:MAG: hypothetical protein M1338_04725 [Patescibacteria group bacterium]|nr:hypothetical protein [Patescibacteria group bacterium]